MRHYRNLASVILVCLLHLLAIGCTGETSAGSSSLPTAELQSMLDGKVRGSTLVPGALLAVARDGMEWTGVAGEGHTSGHCPMAATMRFRIGSLTKHFTAALILQLAEEGKLSLDDTLRKWLPQLQVPHDDSITIRMLLNHTSGVPEFTSVTFWDTLVFPNPTRAWQPGELIELAKKGTSREPGTTFVYCNTGYILAGMVAEAAGGENVANAMARRFFTPLGMGDTELATDGALSGHYAHGYLQLPESQTVDDVSNWNPSCAWTAGAVVTTAHDLLVWTDALFGGRVLSRDSLEKMLTPTAPSTSYGFGLGLKEVDDGRTFIYHSGLIPGYSSTIAHHRASGLTIIILTNREDISRESNDIVTPIFQEASKLLPPK